MAKKKDVQQPARKQEKQMVKVLLTEEEKQELSEKIAQWLKDLETLEGEKKSTASRYDSEIKRAALEIKEARNAILDGYTMQKLLVEIEHNYATKEVLYYRVDTGELVRSRTMRPDEVQIPLFNPEEGGQHDGAATETHN